MQSRTCRNGDLVADRNIVFEFRVVNMSDTDIVPALLDRRIALQSLDALLRVSAKPLGGLNVPADPDLAGASLMNGDGAGAGFHLQVNVPINLQGALELAACCGRSRARRQYNRDSTNWKASTKSFHVLTLKSNLKKRARGRNPCPRYPVIKPGLHESATA